MKVKATRQQFIQAIVQVNSTGQDTEYILEAEPVEEDWGKQPAFEKKEQCNCTDTMFCGKHTTTYQEMKEKCECMGRACRECVDRYLKQKPKKIEPVYEYSEAGAVTTKSLDIVATLLKLIEEHNNQI